MRKEEKERGYDKESMRQKTERKRSRERERRSPKEIRSPGNRKHSSEHNYSLKAYYPEPRTDHGTRNIGSKKDENETKSNERKYEGPKNYHGRRHGDEGRNEEKQERVKREDEEKRKDDRRYERTNMERTGVRQEKPYERTYEKRYDPEERHRDLEKRKEKETRRNEDRRYAKSYRREYEDERRREDEKESRNERQYQKKRNNSDNESQGEYNKAADQEDWDKDLVPKRYRSTSKHEQHEQVPTEVKDSNSLPQQEKDPIDYGKKYMETKNKLAESTIISLNKRNNDLRVGSAIPPLQESIPLSKELPSEQGVGEEVLIEKPTPKTLVVQKGDRRIIETKLLKAASEAAIGTGTGTRKKEDLRERIKALKSPNKETPKPEEINK